LKKRNATASINQARSCFIGFLRKLLSQFSKDFNPRFDEDFTRKTFFILVLKLVAMRIKMWQYFSLVPFSNPFMAQSVRLFLFNRLLQSMLPVKINTSVGERIGSPFDDVS
jgi:hypothetical protein